MGFTVRPYVHSGLAKMFDVPANTQLYLKVTKPGWLGVWPKFSLSITHGDNEVWPTIEFVGYAPNVRLYRFTPHSGNKRQFSVSVKKGLLVSQFQIEALEDFKASIASVQFNPPRMDKPQEATVKYAFDYPNRPPRS